MTASPEVWRRAFAGGRRGPKILAVTSGKGGVGKTQVAMNLAVALAGRGQSTVLLDADLGLANVDVLLGLEAVSNLDHVLKGDRELADILLDGPAGLRIVPAATGVSRLADLSPGEIAGMLGLLSMLPDDLDAMVIDTAPGIGPGVLSFCAAASDVLIVLCDEPTALTDAYALIKVLARERGVKRFQILCNRVRHGLHGRALFEHFVAICDRFLDVSLCHLGSIPDDPAFEAALKERAAVVTSRPSSPSGAAFKELAERADKLNVLEASVGRPTFLVERTLAAAGAPPPPGGR